jgi:hypothetical protein
LFSKTLLSLDPADISELESNLSVLLFSRLTDLSIDITPVSLASAALADEINMSKIINIDKTANKDLFTFILSHYLIILKTAQLKL